MVSSGNACCTAAPIWASVSGRAPAGAATYHRCGWSACSISGSNAMMEPVMPNNAMKTPAINPSQRCIVKRTVRNRTRCSRRFRKGDAACTANVALDLHEHPFAPEFLAARIPGKEDHDAKLDWGPGRSARKPLALLRAGDRRLFTHTLRFYRDLLGEIPDTHFDLLQIEMDVGNCTEQLHIEPRGTGVAFPSGASLADNLVDAVWGQRGDQSGDVAFVLGDRMRLPQLADLAVQLGRHLARQELTNVHRYPCHGLIRWIGSPIWSTTRCTTKSTS